MAASALAGNAPHLFGNRRADGSAQMKDVLGGKGASLAEMTNIGVPVPPGFTISTGVCTCLTPTTRLSAELKAAVDAELEPSVRRSGTFGDEENPLLVPCAPARVRPCPA